MNKLKIEITDKLEIVALTPVIVNKTFPEIEIELCNYKDFKDYEFKLSTKKDNCYFEPKKVINGKCVINSYELFDADELVLVANSKVSSFSLTLKLKDVSFEAKVYINDRTMNYLKLLNSMLEHIEDLDARVQQLEIDNTKDLL